jgi:hypothetical protein
MSKNGLVLWEARREQRLSSMSQAHPEHTYLDNSFICLCGKPGFHHTEP